MPKATSKTTVSAIPVSAPAPVPASEKFFEETIRKMIQDEGKTRDKYFEFAQTQIEKDREYFKFLFKSAVGFLFVLVGFGIYFQYATAGDMKAGLKAEAEAAIKQEVEKAHKEIISRIDAEFDNVNMAELITTAAKERAEKGIDDVVRSEITAQVEKGVLERQTDIQRTVETQAKEAVKTLEPALHATAETEVKESLKAIEPALQETADKAVQEQVKTAVEPVRTQISGFEDVLRMGNMIILARNDDRASFDYLVQVAEGNKTESGNDELKKLADSAVSAIVGEKVFGLSLHDFKEEKTTDDLKKLMTSKLALERQTSIERYPSDDKSILPTLVSMIETDPSVSVLYAATERFNFLTKQSFKFWKPKELLDYWDKNKATFK